MTGEVTKFFGSKPRRIPHTLGIAATEEYVSRSAMTDLEDLLEIRFPAPRWASFRELRQATGFSEGEGRIDFAAFSMWASDGDRVIACEVKRTRADFMREVENPNKRKWVEKQFGECYFVMLPDLVSPDEIPEGWGLLVATKKGDKLRRIKVAQQRSVALSQSLMRSILRRSAASQEEVQEIKQSGHGPGICCPIELVTNAQELVFDARNSSRLEQQVARDAYRSLERLAELAYERGITEWKPALVETLVEKAAAQRLKVASYDLHRARETIDTLCKRLDP